MKEEKPRQHFDLKIEEGLNPLRPGKYFWWGLGHVLPHTFTVL